jgi:serine phosphatase RsbU (regulator of sigma subunit)
MAARVQQQLLPEQTPILAGYDVAGACRPTRAVGGDFFDWDCDGGLMSITLADAMGKGMGAALVAATARAVLRTGKPDRGAEAVVRQAAAVLEADLVRISSFLTLLLLQVDGRTGQAEYVDAGHGLGLVVHPDGSWERLLNGGPPLGLVPGATWNAGNFKLEPGSSAVVVSDGVLDSFAGLEDALQAVSETVRRAEEAKEAVNDVLAMAAAAEDDVTAVVLRRTA